MLNVETMGMDQYCSFHQEYHSKKTCSQWNHNMNTQAIHFIDTVLSDKQTKPTEGKEETVATKETMSVEHAVNTLSCVYAVENKIAKK